MHWALRRITLSTAAQTWAVCATCNRPLTHAITHYALKGLYCSQPCILTSLRAPERHVPDQYRATYKPRSTESPEQSA